MSLQLAAKTPLSDDTEEPVFAKISRRAMVATLVLLLLVVAVAAAAVGDLAGLLIVVIGLTAALLLVALALWWDVRQWQRSESRRNLEVRAHMKRLASQGSEGLVVGRDLAASEHRLREALRQMERAVESGTAQLLTGEDSPLRSEVERASRSLSRFLRGELGHQFRQIESLVALYYDVRPTRHIPATRSWSASPDLLLYLTELVRDRRPKLILECGSGVSTLLMAYVLRVVGVGRLVALEHLDVFADLSRRLLREHGVDDWAEIRLAPLKPVALAGETWLWYDRSHVPAEPIDFLLVDGPPGSTGPQARYPAIPLLKDQLSDRAVVILDDHDREEERAISDRWLDLLPGWARETLPHEKGTAVFRRR